MDPARRASLSSAWRWFALAAAVVLADQVTKAIVLGRFALGERIEVTGFFNMVLVYNKGAAFSFLSEAAGWQTPALIAFALVAIGIVGTFIVRSPGRRMLCTGLALILGGALGNLIDRLRFGQVVDFLDFHAQGWHWPAFNAADSAITLGAALIILEGFLHHEGRTRSAP
jgi:signal peptidase II